jgi:hypothetical protein
VAWRKDALHAKSQKQTLEDLGPKNNSSFGFKHLPIKFSQVRFPYYKFVVYQVGTLFNICKK